MWSNRAPQARMLMMSSIDGYCSVVLFEDGELGEFLGNDVAAATASAPASAPAVGPATTAAAGVAQVPIVA